MTDAAASAVGSAVRRAPTPAFDGGVRGDASAVIRVLVVDDHALFRRGVCSALATTKDLEVVGEAADADAALLRAIELAPDVILLDVRMPGRSGLDVCPALVAAVPGVRVLMLTASDRDEDLYAAIRAGASGYLLKESSVEDVLSAVRSVHGGQSMISPAMAGKLLTEFAAMVRREDELRDAPGEPRLTDRELEVLKLVARGLNNRDIARELFISENTVKNHIRNILEKLQLHSRMEAVVYAVRQKLLEIT
ncbi:MAG TPA: response regulator transcription factor [Candidatus Limnocylindria bacterium]|nr:response regulator transcription factor [Candidatus Limnocylindria bacterium]